MEVKEGELEEERQTVARLQYSEEQNIKLTEEIETLKKEKSLLNEKINQVVKENE